MIRVSSLTGLRVLVPKKPKTSKDGSVIERYSKLGRIHMAVFSPDGRRLVGYTVKRPDAVGMVKREDAFLAWDSFEVSGKQVVVSGEPGALDAAARKRLAIDWDACIMWSGMDVRTVEGKPLGYVSDAEYDEGTGAVTRFFSADGGVANALIGSFQITPDMVRGYRDGFMVVDARGGSIELDGGIAGAAGEGYARAKAGASALGKKAGAVAGEAVDKGSFALGKALGKAKRAIEDAAAPEPAPAPDPAPALDVTVSAPVEGLPATSGDRPAAKTYAPRKDAASATKKGPAPAARKASAKKPAASASTVDRAAKAAGRQLGAMGKMFGSFKEEFDKASR